MKQKLHICLCGIMLIAVVAVVAGAAENFSARIQRSSGRWLPVQVVSITNRQFVLRMEGAEMRVPIKELRQFNWRSPTPVEVGETLINSNQYEQALARLALFETQDFLKPALPSALQRDAIVKLIADAYIGMNRLQEASDIMAFISEDADVVVRRIRIHKALNEYDAAIELAQKYTVAPAEQDPAQQEEGSAEQPEAEAAQAESKAAQSSAREIRWTDRELAQLYYELGTSLLGRKDFEAALDELLKVKVLYRVDMDLVAQCEMRAVECYRGLHQYPRAARSLSNIVSNADYNVVKTEATNELNTVLMEFEKEKELKRRIGGE